LGGIGPDAHVAVGELILLLKNEDSRNRRVAAASLGRIGSKARTAIPALSAALKDDDEGVRVSAADAIKAIQGKK